tara:strand:- start:6711 stop:7043 length:333 start_codon:yes stop_codon:yes gene_type:complete
MSDSIDFNNTFKFTGIDFFDNSGDNLAFPGMTTLGLDSKDMVNSPSHYTSGRVEAIEVIEDATKDAPTVMAGVYQANVLKYLLRLWHKTNSKEDAQKAEWYLKKLIDSLQ